MKRQNFGFTAVTTEGALLPPDLLKRISETDEGLKGLKPTDYNLVPGERLNETINRSWNRLTGLWTAFKTARAKLPATDQGTSLTRERWLLPILQELGYGRLPLEKPIEIGEKIYSISHRYQHSPIHLVSFRAGLDERQAAITGARKTSPHSLLQELLNRSDDFLWGFVSNGLQFRILRDNASLSRQAFVEFDLETIFEGELYADFALFWMLLHQSRVEAEKPEKCWLEIWAQTAREQGTRALERLRSGVEEAIQVLGQGFLKHPANKELRAALATTNGTLSNHDYYREILRLVYQFLFLFVAEDRELLVSGQSSVLYQTYFSTQRLRDLARSFRGTQHSDLFEAFKLVLKSLGDSEGTSNLGLPKLGSSLFSEKAVPHLVGAQLSNKDFLAAIRSLAFTLDQKIYRPVDYRNLGAEELGSVYEGLLELHPKVNAGAAEFKLDTAAGSERKTTGSYYTPTSLVNCLLDSALDPVLDEAASAKNPEEAILNLKICDPACGSGHFLIAAAHRVAKKLASVRTGDLEPPPEAQRSAIRDVIGHCIYGVDLNPMAVELCRVALWIEALEPGKPLSFLDHHIQCGNSLIGATPELILEGMPDEAYEALEGDEKAYCSKLKKQNKAEKKAIGGLFEEQDRTEEAAFRQAILAVEETKDDTVEGLKKKERAWESFLKSPGYEKQKLLADAWCAAFVMPKIGPAPNREATAVVTTETLRGFAASIPLHRAVERLFGAIANAADSFRFLHWHLAFPEVFRSEASGFDVILGNPPWERIKLQEQEWFASFNPEIAKAPNAAARKRMIDGLRIEDPALYADFRGALRTADGESHFLRNSGRYPLCGKGDINTYSVFAELNRTLISETGRVGCIVPSGIATDDTTKDFFSDLIARKNLAAFYGFENEGRLFKGIDHRVNFCLLVMSGPPVDAPHYAAFIREPNILRDPDRTYRLTGADIEALNPNTRTCPVFRNHKDAVINIALYHRVGVLWRESVPDGNRWGLRFLRMLDMANDSGLFKTAAQLSRGDLKPEGNRFVGSGTAFLPLLEAKMLHLYNHRFGDFALLEPGEREHILPQVSDDFLNDPNYLTKPRYWVAEEEVHGRTAGIWERRWLLGWRDVTDARSSVRTVVACVIPRTGVGDKFLLMLPSLELDKCAALQGNLSSFILDYAARQKVGGTALKYFTMKQLPVLPPSTYTQPAAWDPTSPLSSWITPRVLELTYTAWDLKPFAEDLAYSGPPFRWNPERRFLLRAELDAAFFHLYGIVRDDVDYIMETFPIVKKNDEKAFGEFKTKRVILEIYDEMAEAMKTGKPYRTRLEPPAADERVAHEASPKQEQQ